MVDLNISIVVDNNDPIDPECRCAPAPGLSMLLERNDFSVMLDTGPDKTILYNADLLEMDRSKISALVISHRHRDHTGGLEAVFEQRPDLKVFLPENLDVPFGDVEVIEYDAKIMNVPEGSLWLIHGIGEYKGYKIPENALVLVDDDGDAYVFCGCCHIGIENVLHKIKEIGFEPIFVAGGLHLAGKPREELEKIADEIVNAGVEIAMPIHCSGSTIADVLDEKGVTVILSGVCSQVPLEYRP